MSKIGAGRNTSKTWKDFLGDNIDEVEDSVGYNTEDFVGDNLGDTEDLFM